ncbi:MAG: sterol desaturase family protein [Bdellovibrionales bacterium]|nr:sterol desaturase family protein [Bdellovibrionales bacterium]
MNSALESPILFGLISSFGIAIRYFIIAGAAYFVFWVQGKRRFQARKIQPGKMPRPGVMRREILWSVLSSFVFGFSGIWAFRNWMKLASGWSVGFSMSGFVMGVATFCLLAFLHDTYFYWMHRLVHHPKLFRLVHRVHHESVTPSPWAAFSFHPLEAILEALILPVLLLFIPVTPIVLVCFLVWMTILGVVNHLGYDPYFRGFDEHSVFKWMISARNHDHHHVHPDRNFGLYFTFWDHWMGTQWKRTDLNRLNRAKSDSQISASGEFARTQESLLQN